MRPSSANTIVALTTLASLFSLAVTAGIPPATSLELQPRADRTITKTKTVARTTKTVVKTTTKTLKKVTVTKTSTKTLPKVTVTKTATVTKPASTVVRTTTVSGPIRTTTSIQTSTKSVTLPASTVTETETVSVAPPQNAPNGKFEEVPDTGAWCKGLSESPCSIVNKSNDGSFSGLFGPNMLEAGLAGTESFGSLWVPVPVASTRNPSGRDWTLTAWYRPPAGNPKNCWPIMGWRSDAGMGYGFQPDLNGQDAWQSFSRVLPQSAGGREGNWGVYVTSGCFPDKGVLYIDGVIVD